MIDPAALVNQAIRLRDSGDETASAKLLDEILAEAPNHTTAYYERAILRRETGDLAGAASCLENSLRLAGPDARTSLFLAQMRYGLADFSAGDAALALLPPGQDVAAMMSFGAFLREFPLPRALNLLLELKRRHRYLDTAEIAAALHTALREQTPFALVRLGDGEGAWTQLDAAAESRHAPLYAQNRAEMAGIWFGPDFTPLETRFAALTATLPDELAGWDVTGIPYSSWLRREYTIASPRGAASLLKLIRRLLVENLPPETAFCRQLANIDLLTEGHLPGILCRAKDITIITCHDELPTQLETQFQLSGTKLLRVPGERGRADLLGPAALRGTHFPTRFDELQSELQSQNWHGRLVLIAAGILGKFYAGTIRRQGGIALDIGSLADLWMGRPTRPGHAALMEKPGLEEVKKGQGSALDPLGPEAPDPR